MMLRFVDKSTCKRFAALRRLMTCKRGETLTEVLAAIVVSGLAILLLAMAISSAASTNMKTRDAFDSYYAGNNAIAAFEGAQGADGASQLKSGTVTLKTADSQAGSQTAIAIVDESDKDGIEVEYVQQTQGGNVVVVAYAETETTG